MSVQIRELPANGVLPNFTPRELEVMHRMGLGIVNKTIGAELGIVKRTVDIYTTNIYRKLGLKGRAAFLAWYAARFAERCGIAPTTISAPALSPIQQDAEQLLEALRGVMRGDPRARSMARVLLERHSGKGSEE